MRLVRFQPSANLAPGENYIATLEAGARLVDGSVTVHDHSYAFQIECDTAEDPRCPPVIVTDDPTIIVFSPTPTRTATPVATPTPAVSAVACAGDCASDAAVTVDELVLCVNVAMTGLPTCPACDVDANGQVTIDALVKAVDAVLSGCRR